VVAGGAHCRRAPAVPAPPLRPDAPSDGLWRARNGFAADTYSCAPGGIFTCRHSTRNAVRPHPTRDPAARTAGVASLVRADRARRNPATGRGSTAAGRSTGLTATGSADAARRPRRRHARGGPRGARHHGSAAHHGSAIAGAGGDTRQPAAGPVAECAPRVTRAGARRPRPPTHHCCRTSTGGGCVSCPDRGFGRASRVDRGAGGLWRNLPGCPARPRRRRGSLR